MLHRAVSECDDECSDQESDRPDIPVRQIHFAETGMSRLSMRLRPLGGASLFHQEPVQFLLIDSQTLPVFNVDRSSFLIVRINQNLSQEEGGLP